MTNELILDYTVPAMDVELDEARLTFETNLFSVITMCQTFVPLLIKAKGTIVQIGSVAGVCIYGLSYQNRDDYILTLHRSSRTCLALSTMPPRLLYTHSAIPSASS